MKGNSPIPYMGGKRRLAKNLLPLFPRHTAYIEPFCGGASMLFMRQEAAAVEVINDLDSELVNFYRVTKHHPETFISEFKNAIVSRKVFEWERQKPPETMTDIQRAARFYYLQKLSFGARGSHFGTSKTSPPRLNLLRIEEDISEAFLRLSRVTVECLSWDECIRRYEGPETFFFVDPPYWETESYPVGEFPWEQYVKLAEVMRKTPAKMMLTINNHPAIRKLFSEFKQQALSISYTVGGSRNRSSSSELVIVNYKA